VDRNPTSRRRFLSHLAVGGVALGVGLPAAAAAQEDDEGTAADEDAHEDAAALVETIELAAATFYDRAVASGTVQSPPAIAMLADFGRHHREHGDRFGDVAGTKSVGEPNRRLLQTFLDQLEQKTSEQAVLLLAVDVETALSSTHLAGLHALDDDTLVELVASVLPVEASHAAAVARAAGLPPDRAVPEFENLDLALDTSQYPATTTTTTTTA
jgi:hypothetical protein